MLAVLDAILFARFLIDETQSDGGGVIAALVKGHIKRIIERRELGILSSVYYLQCSVSVSGMLSCDSLKCVTIAGSSFATKAPP